MGYGVESETNEGLNIVAGAVREAYLTVDAAATVSPGQVYQYNDTENNYDDFTAGATALRYAVCNEAAKTISADTQVRCIIAGPVQKDHLDATSKADADIDVALGKCGIFAEPNAIV